MKKILTLLTAAIIGLASANQIHAQRFLNKLQDRAEDKILDEIFDEDEKEAPPDRETGKTSTSNTRGEGLSASAIDVPACIDAASASYKSEKYTQSRNSVREAIQGIELEIGKKVLESLPQSVNDLSGQADADRVTSSGINFAGLMIEREYAKGDQELRVVIANNSAWLTSVNLYLSSGGYATTEEQPDYKKITFQGYQGVIEYDEGSGYKLSVPFGQSSIFVLNGINFSNEQQVMNAAGKFSIDNIKRQLGEQ
ncbi:MAG: hypothetical protein JW723_10625 [Bacteroidales bacterium]|nr:hypothetical protein [Bacteroidales bacterium]